MQGLECSDLAVARKSSGYAGLVGIAVLALGLVGLGRSLLVLVLRS